MKISNSLTDEAVLAELGGRLARRRLDLRLTQAELAEQAGVGKRTVERMEAGEPAQTTTLVRVLRVLGLLASLGQAIPEGGSRPMDLLSRKGRQRQRAPSRDRDEATDVPWTWNDST